MLLIDNKRCVFGENIFCGSNAVWPNSPTFLLLSSLKLPAPTLSFLRLHQHFSSDKVAGE
jgi:hypothetical protein